eukprot:CAMPEP_0176403802 /NCGR_PEP_ID=MMETSP0126-20121128/50381_1 /TAXON_ID=141414 ORGANISM="Strombidinopsis acuminatum, Strain SPMC142" /NCGR_SAMPLE_ID=MMETSP0126 /ASSEMBLY_ACC=CAM_ASM_000229 /LENGTH=64 /DNA_ID=CAMNT_0017782261 /DNA_START=299 /DNA_END=493 /DNA_ORIENTATION=-
MICENDGDHEAEMCCTTPDPICLKSLDSMEFSDSMDQGNLNQVPIATNGCEEFTDENVRVNEIR